MEPKFVQDQGERALVLYSDATGPIDQMSFLHKALLFAELAMISYNDENEATRAAEKIGFPDVTFFDHDGSQAFRFRNDHDCVIACRGTEPNEWNDIRADVNAATVLAETAGKVHRGFKREVDDLWPMLETALAARRERMYADLHTVQPDSGRWPRSAGQSNTARPTAQKVADARHDRVCFDRSRRRTCAPAGACVLRTARHPTEAPPAAAGLANGRAISP